MKATRKDYEAVAAMLRSERDTVHRDASTDDAAKTEALVSVGRIANQLADLFAQGNDRFDRDRFLTAVYTD